MNNFTSNIDLSPSVIASMISRIQVPKGHALVGVMPILVIIFGSDDVSTVSAGLDSLSSMDAGRLIERVKEVVMDVNYPLSESVWQFNDPQADIDVLATMLGVDTVDMDDRYNAKADVDRTFEMLRDTFPFLPIFSEELEREDILPFRSDYVERASIQKDITSASPEIGAHAVIIPSIALGSLVLLTSKLKSSGET